MNNNIRKIRRDGTVSTFAGSLRQTAGTTDGQGTAAFFNGPTGITRDNSGNIYVLDAISGLIRKIMPDGLVTTIAGSTAGFQDGIGSNAQFAFLYATNP